MWHAEIRDHAAVESGACPVLSAETGLGPVHVIRMRASYARSLLVGAIFFGGIGVTLLFIQAAVGVAALGLAGYLAYRYLNWVTEVRLGPDRIECKTPRGVRAIDYTQLVGCSLSHKSEGRGGAYYFRLQPRAGRPAVEIQCAALDNAAWVEILDTLAGRAPVLAPQVASDKHWLAEQGSGGRA